jgi:hypothetical protein
VNRSRQELFAGSSFTGDEYRHSGRRNAPDAFEDVAQCGRSPNAAGDHLSECPLDVKVNHLHLRIVRARRTTGYCDN